jgi:rubrerythrin
MAAMSMDSPEMQAFVAAIAKMLLISLAEATALLESWQTAQEDVEEKLRAQQEEVQKAKLERRMALVPIWRCAVCGRADMPYIACYVSPYIVRYEEREV